MEPRKILAFFFPERCPFCNALIEADEIACQKCTDLILRDRIPITRGVGGVPCVASLEYSKAQHAITEFKFNDKQQFARQFAAIMHEDIRRCLGDIHFDCIAYVPMRKRDIELRGYNQSQLLAKELSKRMDIPVCDALMKVKSTKKQHETEKVAERRKNLKGAFRVSPDAEITGKHILLIDDIVTSGSTMDECIRTLTKSHPAQICCASIARTGIHIDNLPTL